MGYKCKPITQRAKSSPFKINETLVAGAAQVGKKFIDAGAAMRENMENGGGSEPERTYSKPNNQDNSEEKTNNETNNKTDKTVEKATNEDTSVTEDK